MRLIHLVPVLTVVVARDARAQPTDAEDLNRSPEADVGAVNHAFEIGLGMGYVQPRGELGGGMGQIQDLVGPGGSLELDLGARVWPRLSFSVFGALVRSATGNDVATSTQVRGGAAGLMMTLHLRPGGSIDPWVSYGAGWRGWWLRPERGETTSLQGVELARVRIGIDYRLSPSISIAPVVGGTVDMFVRSRSAMTTGYDTIKDADVNFTGFLGVAGRFDIGGTR